MSKEEFKAAAKEAKRLRKAQKAAEKGKALKPLEEGTASPAVTEEPAENRKDKKKKRKLEEEADEERRKSKKSKKTEQSNDDPAETAQAPEEKKKKKEKKKKNSEEEEQTPEDCNAQSAKTAQKDDMQKDFIAFEPESMEGVITNGDISSKKDKKKKSKKDKKDKKEKKEKKASNGISKTDNAEVTPNEGTNGAIDAFNDATNGEEQTEADGALKKKERFIVFVGNLPFTATKKDIEEHFAKISPSSVRLMTDKDTGKSKGFAFVDFDGYDKMKTCLKLYHHSVSKDGTKKGRQINVELTAGGGGNTEDRKAKIQAKNVKLHDERRRRREAEEKQQQRKEAKEAKQKKNKGEGQQNGAAKAPPVEQPPAHEGIHPSRLRQLQF